MMDFGRLGDDVGLGNDAGLGNEAGYIQDRFGLQYLGNRSLSTNMRGEILRLIQEFIQMITHPLSTNS